MTHLFNQKLVHLLKRFEVQDSALDSVFLLYFIIFFANSSLAQLFQLNIVFKLKLVLELGVVAGGKQIVVLALVHAYLFFTDADGSTNVKFYWQQSFVQLMV